MEGKSRPSRTVEGNLKDKHYVGQFRDKSGADRDLRMLPDITNCTT